MTFKNHEEVKIWLDVINNFRSDNILDAIKAADEVVVSYRQRMWK